MPHVADIYHDHVDRFVTRKITNGAFKCAGKRYTFLGSGDVDGSTVYVALTRFGTPLYAVLWNVWERRTKADCLALSEVA